MSQDIEFSEDPHPESAIKDHLVSDGINACSCESAPLRITCSVSDQHCCEEDSNHTCRPQGLTPPNEVSVAFVTPLSFLIQYIRIMTFHWFNHYFLFFI